MSALQLHQIAISKQIEEVEAFPLDPRVIGESWSTLATQWKYKAISQLETLAIEVDSLLEAGVSLEKEEIEQRFPIVNNYVRMCSIVSKNIEHLTNPSFTSLNSMFHFAIQKNNYELVELLIPYIELSVIDKSSCLRRVAGCGQVEIAKLLIANNFLEQTDTTIEKAVSIAIKRKNYNVAMEITCALPQTARVDSCLHLLNQGFDTFDNETIKRLYLIMLNKMVVIENYASTPSFIKFLSLLGNQKNDELLVWCLQQTTPVLFLRCGVLNELLSFVKHYIIENGLIGLFTEFMGVLTEQHAPHILCKILDDLTSKKTTCTVLFLTALLESDVYKTYLIASMDERRNVHSLLRNPNMYNRGFIIYNGLADVMCLLFNHPSIPHKMKERINETVVSYLSATRIPSDFAMISVLPDPSIFNDSILKQLIALHKDNSTFVRHHIITLISDKRVNPSISLNLLVRIAAKDGDTELLEQLMLDERVDPSDLDNEALCLAVRNNKITAAKIILRDSRVNPATRENMPLAIALQNGYFEFAKKLMADSRVAPSKEFLIEYLSQSKSKGIDIRAFTHRLLKVTPPSIG